MFGDVGLTDRFTYDGEICLGLYQDYLRDDSKDNLENLLLYAKRHVLIRIRKSYLKRIRRDVCEDLAQAALIELWDVFQKKAIPHDGNVAVFHKYLNTVIHRKVAKTFAVVYDDAPKKLDAQRYVEETFRRLPCSDDEENALFRAELPQVLKDRVLARVRFRNPKAREAIEDILDRSLIYHEMVVEGWLKRNWQVEDPAFLIEHVLILLRDELYKLRQDITFRTNLEKRDVLSEGIEEYFTDYE
jgi:hypothetical protein